MSDIPSGQKSAWKAFMEAIKSVFWPQNLAGLKKLWEVFECPELKYEVHLVPKKLPQVLANMQALIIHYCTAIAVCSTR